LNTRAPTIRAALGCHQILPLRSYKHTHKCNTQEARKSKNQDMHAFRLQWKTKSHPKTQCNTLKTA
jgi:hypothetical protein